MFEKQGEQGEQPRKGWKMKSISEKQKAYETRMKNRARSEPITVISRKQNYMGIKSWEVVGTQMRRPRIGRKPPRASLMDGIPMTAPNPVMGYPAS